MSRAIQTCQISLVLVPTQDIDVRITIFNQICVGLVHFPLPPNPDVVIITIPPHHKAAMKTCATDPPPVGPPPVGPDAKVSIVGSMSKIGM